MQTLIETIIYLLAIMGIIFTSFSIFEMFSGKNLMNNTYKIIKSKEAEERKIEVSVKFTNVEEKIQEEIIEKIKTRKL